MRDPLGVYGATAPSGRKFVCVSSGEIAAWLPLHDFVLGNKLAFAHLADQGLLIFDNVDANMLIQQVKELKQFLPADIVECVGWNGDVYALPDGTIFSANEEKARHVAFRAYPRKCETAGSLKEWKEKVAGPLEGQALGGFVLMLAFVAPLLRFMPLVKNFAIELVGREGVGKSTLQYLMSSVLGGIGLGNEGRYWNSLDTTVNALEDAMIEHKDHPIIFDEANLLLAGQGSKAVADSYTALAFKLSSGDQKRRFRESREVGLRIVALISTNQSLREMVDPKSAKTRAAGDRIITIRIPSHWKHGVYEFLPEGYADGAEYGEALTLAANDHHGHPYRRFIQKLVKTLAKNEARIVDHLERSQAEFLGWTAVDGNKGSDHRVARAFAAVYAAGVLAQKLNILPRTLDCKDAALACFRLHLAERVVLVPFIDRLEALAQHKDILVISGIADKKTQAKRAQQALGTLLVKSTHREIRIDPKKIMVAFPDWDRLREEKEVQGYLVKDGSHRQAKASLAPGQEKRRIWCLRFPLEADDLFDAVNNG